MKLGVLTAATVIVFPSIALANTLLWPIPQYLSLGQVELNLDVCAVFFFSY